MRQPVGVFRYYARNNNFCCSIQKQAMYGYTTDPEDILYKAIRAHGNTTEYVPIIAVLIYILGTMPVSSWVLWCVIVI